MGSLLLWKMQPLKHILLIRSELQFLCVWYSHTKCPRESKRIHIPVHQSSWERQKLCSSYWRQDQRLCTAQATFSNELIQVCKREKTRTLPGLSRPWEERGTKDLLLKASLQTGLWPVTRCWHKISFTSTSHGQIPGTRYKEGENKTNA